MLASHSDTSTSRGNTVTSTSMVGSAGILPAGFGILPNPVIQRAAKGSRKVKVQPPTTAQTVIYRSKRHHTTKLNFEIFKATG